MKRTSLCGLIVALAVSWGGCSEDAATGNNNNNDVTPECGNGIVESDIGETCDDGASNSDTDPDACRTSCQVASCGDGVADNGEDCDGDDVNGAICADLPPLNHGSLSCNLDCTFDTDACYRCGDGAIDPGEDCDGDDLGVVDTETANCGNITGKPDGVLACLTDCTHDISECALCGDGLIEGAEECDDASSNSDQPNADCRLNCTTAGCGDGITDHDAPVPEQCDCGIDAMAIPSGCVTVNADGVANTCNTDCTLPECGDGQNDNLGLFGRAPEECDLGIGVNCEDAATCACNTQCELPACGNGVLEAHLGEQCDCGDTASQKPAACADINCISHASCECNLNCRTPACGNGDLDFDEGCDNGAANCDDTSSCSCATTCEPPGCGNGAHEPYLGEGCDLGAANCSHLATCACNEICQIPGCGNGWEDFGEDCDQGSGTNCNTAGCTCATTCKAPGCGNGALEAHRGESCDCGDDPANPAAGCTFANCDDGSWCECTPNCSLPWLAETGAGSTATLRAVVVMGMEALAVGNHGGTASTILARDSGGTWTAVDTSSLPLVDLYDICAYGNGQVFAVGENMTRWLGQKVAGVWQFSAPAWASPPAAGLITGVSCYSAFPNSYYTTADGRILNQLGNVSYSDATNTPYRSVAMYLDNGGTLYDGAAIGDSGRRAWKQAAGSWTAGDFAGLTNHLNDVWAETFDFKILVGTSGHIRISTGGSAFNPVNPSPTTANLHSVTGFGTNAWAVGELGTILHYDGSNWTTETALTVTNTFRGVDVDGTSALVIAVGDSGVIYRRP